MHNRDCEKIGVAIRSARAKRGLSVTDLADQLGVNRSAIYQWETARRRIHADRLCQIASVLSIDPSSLLSGTEA